MGKAKEDPNPTGKEGDGISGFTHTRSTGAHGFNECCALLPWSMSGKALHDILLIRLSVRLVAVCKLKTTVVISTIWVWWVGFGRKSTIEKLYHTDTVCVFHVGNR